ncbi:MAG: chromate transporter [Clostridia bacterium]|nr:chromate transporter [Clostridia bacterium]
MNIANNKLLTLFLVFFKVGLFTIGGGLAMLPLYRQEFSEKRDWLTDEEMVDIIAMTQSLPGVMAINSAAFVGYRIAKVRGAIIAALGAILPSVIIILAVGVVYASVFRNEFVVRAFRGVQCALAAMIVAAGIKMIKNTIKSVFAAVVAISAGVWIFFDSTAIIYAIIAAAAAGGIYFGLKRKDRPAPNNKDGEAGA